MVAAAIEIEPWFEWRVHDGFGGRASSAICDFVGRRDGEGQEEEDGKGEDLGSLAHRKFDYSPSHPSIFRQLAQKNGRVSDGILTICGEITGTVSRRNTKMPEMSEAGDAQRLCTTTSLPSKRKLRAPVTQ